MQSNPIQGKIGRLVFLPAASMLSPRGMLLQVLARAQSKKCFFVYYSPMGLLNASLVGYQKPGNPEAHSSDDSY